uniref:Uncharacterized protein n=1 Tax=Rhizophora mucronata TaxID=61149 RepID=A0A2P2N1X0_RHIMU
MILSGVNVDFFTFVAKALLLRMFNIMLENG